MAEMESQMDMFIAGGLQDEGGSTDPVSGNDVPVGSLQEEVRDDIPAQLSEGEFVFPADVVRYIGLENLMELRQKAKAGLAKMEAMGQMGNSEEAIISDDGDFDNEVDRFIDELDSDVSVEFNVGGLAGQNPSGQQQPVGGFLPPNVTPPSGDTSTLPKAPAPLNTVPVYETKQYIGPTGELRTFTFVNGQPIQPIPEGFKEYTGQEQAPQIETPEVEQIDVQPEADGGEETRRRNDLAYRDFLDEVKTLSQASPEFRKKAEEKYPDQLKAAEAMVINPLTGEVTFPGLSVKDQISGALGKAGKVGAITEGIKGIFGDNAIDEAYTEVSKNLGINLEDYTNRKDVLEEIKNRMGSSPSALVADVKSRARRSKTPSQIAEERIIGGFRPLTASGEVSSQPIDVSRAAATALYDAPSRVQDTFAKELAKQEAEIQARRDSDDERSGAGVGRGESPTGSDVAGTPFKKGGLASAKTKPKRKTKMKRGGLASKK